MARHVKKTRLWISFWTALLLVASALRGAPPIEFVHISDTHVANFTGVNPRLAAARQKNEIAAAAFTRFLDRMGHDSLPAFIVHTGDALEAYCFDGAGAEPVFGQIPLFAKLYSRSRIPLYLALGNHDIERYRMREGAELPLGDQSVSPQARRDWMQALQCFRKGTYYSLRKQVGRTAYLFLFLDNGETKETLDPKFLATQMRWVAGQAKGHPRDSMILLMHIPFRQDAFFKALESTVQASWHISMLLAGHRHTNGIEEITLGGHPVAQVRTGSLAISDSNWRRFRLAEDRIEVLAPGDAGGVLKTIQTGTAAH